MQFLTIAFSLNISIPEKGTYTVEREKCFEKIRSHQKAIGCIESFECGEMIL